ncbi:MAG TPA: HD domain-containing protein [Candidatus Magasanikbacteria bacterium]|nr:HD domain-containing protein [Candidatus Magasanikbacteria bacterium]
MAANNKLAHLETFFWELLNSLKKVKRWGCYSVNTPESVDQHTFKMGVLTLIVILWEKRYGCKDFDAFKVLALALIHDWAEGRTGDVLWQVKKDPRLAPIFKVVEKELLDKFLDEYWPEEIRTEISSLYENLDNLTTVEGRLFRAIEELGYVSYAIYEVEQGRQDFVDVFPKHFESLEKAAQEFVSVAQIWNEMKKVISLYYSPE